jgi:deferrochelatase/peroxidase EfeB
MNEQLERALRLTERRLILCGHEGDKQAQPAWAKDGSFLVFRDLQQLVPEFDTYVAYLVLIFGVSF